ncbi:hypothetical protein M9H77_27654 [Catharanthus roseus]|uniref:Uncharacterized protein n=1 Tax=Catharanthus roseus TaxID=4058 RepID=A0ACC0AH92_CATRO|nr:hypothetical protein M9H77_27654 [Catharanthus roseus]
MIYRQTQIFVAAVARVLGLLKIEHTTNQECSMNPLAVALFPPPPPTGHSDKTKDLIEKETTSMIGLGNNVVPFLSLATVLAQKDWSFTCSCSSFASRTCSLAAVSPPAEADWDQACRAKACLSDTERASESKLDAYILFVFSAPLSFFLISPIFSWKFSYGLTSPRARSLVYLGPGKAGRTKKTTKKEGKLYPMKLLGLRKGDRARPSQKGFDDSSDSSTIPTSNLLGVGASIRALLSPSYKKKTSSSGAGFARLLGDQPKSSDESLSGVSVLVHRSGGEGSRHNRHLVAPTTTTPIFRQNPRFPVVGSTLGRKRDFFQKLPMYTIKISISYLSRRKTQISFSLWSYKTKMTLIHSYRWGRGSRPIPTIPHTHLLPTPASEANALLVELLKT